MELKFEIFFENDVIKTLKVFYVLSSLEKSTFNLYKEFDTLPNLNDVVVQYLCEKNIKKEIKDGLTVKGKYCGI